MMTLSSFNDGAKRLAKANNLSIEVATHYMSLIGDTPELTEDGKKVIVRENNKIIALIDYP